MPEFVTRDSRAGWAALRQGAVVDAKPGFDWNSSGNAQILDSAGTAQLVVATDGVTIANPLVTQGGATNNATAGAANSWKQSILLPTNIPALAATSVMRFTIPNVNVAAVFRVLALVTIADGVDAFESTRVAEFQVVATRVAGGSAAIAVSSVIGAQIATVGSGSTFTFAATVTAVSGGSTATQTSDLQFNVTPSAITPNYKVMLLVSELNSETGGVTYAAV